MDNPEYAQLTLVDGIWQWVDLTEEDFYRMMPGEGKGGNDDFQSLTSNEEETRSCSHDFELGDDEELFVCTEEQDDVPFWCVVKTSTRLNNFEIRYVFADQEFAEKKAHLINAEIQWELEHWSGVDFEPDFSAKAIVLSKSDLFSMGYSIRQIYVQLLYHLCKRAGLMRSLSRMMVDNHEFDVFEWLQTDE